MSPVRLGSIIIYVAAVLSPVVALARETPLPPPSEATAGGTEQSSQDGISAREVFGYTAVGLGGATTVAGVVMAVLSAVRYSDLECPDDSCPPEIHEDAEAYNDLRVPAGLTIFAGAALIGLGIPWLVIGDSTDATLSAILAPGYAGLSGRF